MAITTALCNSYKQEILQGIHLAADTYKIALYTNAATLGKGTTAYSATNEVSGTGYTAGGATLSGFAATLDGDVACLDFADPSWANATITARGALIYNASRSNKAVAAFDFGADVSSTNATFAGVLPAADASNALIRIA
jgi:hypothetical protein